MGIRYRLFNSAPRRTNRRSEITTATAGPTSRCGGRATTPGISCRTTAGFTAFSWGSAGDIAAPGDFDGDGKTDVAVFRPSTGVWYIAGSSAGFSTRNWGTQGDIPITADYDGDGKADVAVFRPSTNTWFLMGSTAGIIQYQFGATGDVPIPSVFAY